MSNSMMDGGLAITWDNMGLTFSFFNIISIIPDFTLLSTGISYIDGDNMIGKRDSTLFFESSVIELTRRYISRH